MLNGFWTGALAASVFWAIVALALLAYAFTGEPADEFAHVRVGEHEDCFFDVCLCCDKPIDLTCGMWFYAYDDAGYRIHKGCADSWDAICEETGTMEAHCAEFAS